MKRMLIAALVVLAGGPTSAAESLSIYNWGEYIDLTIIEEFERETGVKVVYDTYESGETTEAMMMAGGSGYDLVVIASEYLGRLISAEVIRPLEIDRLSNAGNLWDDVMERVAAHDPGGRYTIPYLWGTTGLGYNVGEISARMPDAPLDSWAMLFDPNIVSRFADCGVSMIDGPEEVLGAALAYLGRDPNSSDPKDIADAQAAIARIAPYVQTFDSEHINDLANGRTCLALSWSGDALAAADRAIDGIEVSYAIPKEGAPIWFDLFVSPADAKNADAAHQFIDFVLRPEIIARCTNEVWYPNPNAAATGLVDAEVLANPAIYPPHETMSRLFALNARPPKEKRAIARAWNRLKLGL